MLKLAAFALCIVYFACVVVGVSSLGPTTAPWFLSGLSAAFVWCYLSFARGRVSVALAVVIVVTLVLPIGALIAIGWPVYRSWTALAASFWGAFQERGPLGGVELLAPAVAATLCAGIVAWLRSNIAVNPDAPSARRLP
jgi:hypothetical protein